MAADLLARERLAAPLEELALSHVGRTRAGLRVRTRRFRPAAQPAQQIGANRVKQVVPRQGERVHHRERRLGTCHLGVSDGPVQGDDGSWRIREQLIVQRQDPAPVRCRRV